MELFQVIMSLFTCYENCNECFRLENEHLNNCGKFRAVRDISVAPLDASDQQQIIKMMDEPDPTVLFRKKKILKSYSVVMDPQKVPLLSDEDKKDEKDKTAAFKQFHLGNNRKKKSDSGKLDEDLHSRLLGND